VPRRGLQYIQVGRAEEVKALVEDIERIKEGGSAVRFIIGEYGSGKTFLMQLVRSAALEQNLVTMHGDLAPNRRLDSSQGQARALYAELAKNLSTRAKPDGGAMRSVVERFVGSARKEADNSNSDTSEVISERLDHFKEKVGGFAFAKVLNTYWFGYRDGDTAKKENAIRWLRGEYSTKTDVRKDLGVRRYINDDNAYDYLKLFAQFVVEAGYDGLLVGLDEMVNLYQISHSTARKNNYEQLLRIVNDCLQGSAEHLGFLMCGTPEFLTDTRTGLYSYEALRSRLQENTFATEEHRDLTGPVIRLSSLTPEELYVLLENLRSVHAGEKEEDHLVPDEALEAFMERCSNQVGERYFKNPRETVREFVNFISILEQNPELEWQELIDDLNVQDGQENEALSDPSVDEEDDSEIDEPDGDDANELSSFEL
jgi:hypothetical protein